MLNDVGGRVASRFPQFQSEFKRTAGAMLGGALMGLRPSTGKGRKWIWEYFGFASGCEFDLDSSSEMVGNQSLVSLGAAERLSWNR